MIFKNNDGLPLAPMYGATAFIVGAGPGLGQVTKAQARDIERCHALRFALNHGGRGKDGVGWIVKPTHWTAYDVTVQFSPTVFRDPSIIKLVRQGRDKDVIPDLYHLKVSDCPSVYYYTLKDEVKHTDYFNPEATHLTDTKDSLVMAMHAAVCLGARRLYLIGTDMVIRPTQEQLEYAASVGVKYPVAGEVKNSHFKYNPKGHRYSDKLFDLVRACGIAAGKSEQEAESELARRSKEREHYAISETKSFHTSLLVDEHYFWIAQQLRLARNSLMRYGVQVTSCTPDSRLNAIFEYKPLSAILRQLRSEGDVRDESTIGAYTTAAIRGPFMQDYPVFKHKPPTVKRNKEPDEKGNVKVVDMPKPDEPVPPLKLDEL